MESSNLHTARFLDGNPTRYLRVDVIKSNKYVWDITLDQHKREGEYCGEKRKDFSMRM